MVNNLYFQRYKINNKVISNNNKVVKKVDKNLNKTKNNSKIYCLNNLDKNKFRKIFN
jgi:hypothetical protein